MVTVPVWQKSPTCSTALGLKDAIASAPTAKAGVAAAKIAASRIRFVFSRNVIFNMIAFNMILNVRSGVNACRLYFGIIVARGGNDV